MRCKVFVTVMLLCDGKKEIKLIKSFVFLWALKTFYFLLLQQTKLCCLSMWKKKLECVFFPDIFML